MKANPFGVVTGIGLLVVGIALGQPLFAVLGSIIALATVFLAANRTTRDRWHATGEMDLSNESRTLLRPILRLAAELEEFFAKGGKSPSVRAVSHEALADARHITDQCRRLLRTRDEIKGALKGRGAAEYQLQHLDGAESEALDSARLAHQLELQHYEEAMQAIPRIDAQIHQAQAALSEMKARLALALSRESGTEEVEGVREAVGRLKAMSATIDEAENLLKGGA